MSEKSGNTLRGRSYVNCVYVRYVGNPSIIEDERKKRGRRRWMIIN